MMCRLLWRTVVALLVLSSAAQAQLQLARLFTDGAVLQRGAVLRVWGWATKGSTVSVSFAGQTVTTKTAPDGQWLLSLKPLEASSVSRTLQVKSGEESITVQDVLVGEVWFAAGQSNMEMTMHAAATYSGGECEQVPVIVDSQIDARKQILKATDPQLRFFKLNGPQSPLGPAAKIPVRYAWRACKAAASLRDHESTASFSGVAYYFAKRLREQLGVPVGVLDISVGGTTVQAWQSKESLARVPRGAEYVAEWEAKAKAFAPKRQALQDQFAAALKVWEKSDRKGRRPEEPRDPLKSRSFPATFYNGVFAPVRHTTVRGTIWYQGENNYYQDLGEEHESDNMSRSHAALLSAMIQNWRSDLQNPAMPFYVVQLPPYMRSSNASEFPNSNGWTLIRDEQRRAVMMTRHTGLVSTIDIQEWGGTHPPFTPPLHTIDKSDVGYRLADMALGRTYGAKLPVVSGPMYKGIEIKGERVVVTFSEVGSGLMVGAKTHLGPGRTAQGALRHFLIADADKKWHRAEAVIVSSNQVAVWGKGVTQPVAVRYAWLINPYGVNLFNKEGLPASPFRSDDWTYRYTNIWGN